MRPNFKEKVLHIFQGISLRLCSSAEHSQADVAFHERKAYTYGLLLISEISENAEWFHSILQQPSKFAGECRSDRFRKAHAGRQATWNIDRFVLRGDLVISSGVASSQPIRVRALASVSDC